MRRWKSIHGVKIHLEFPSNLFIRPITILFTIRPRMSLNDVVTCQRSEREMLNTFRVDFRGAMSNQAGISPLSISFPPGVRGDFDHFSSERAEITFRGMTIFSLFPHDRSLDKLFFCPGLKVIWWSRKPSSELLPAFFSPFRSSVTFFSPFLSSLNFSCFCSSQHVKTNKKPWRSEPRKANGIFPSSASYSPGNARWDKKEGLEGRDTRP